MSSILDNPHLDEFRIDLVVKMIGDSVKQFNGKNILWTGTNGFLGQWVLKVVEYLNNKILEDPCTLHAFDVRLPEKDLVDRLKPSRIYFHAHDLTTKLWPMAEKMDYVVHMAGIASPYHYKLRPLDTIDVALEGVRSALEISRNSGAKFLFTSSSEVYQTASVIPTPETYIGAIASNNDRSCYDVSKLMGENMCYVYHRQFGVDAAVVRIFNSFGPGISERDSRILPRIASSIVSGKPISVYSGSRQPKRTYCPAGNTVAGIFLALLDGRAGEIYNIGMDKPEVTVVELLDIIQESRGISIPHRLIAPPPVYVDEPLRRCPDISKARRELNYSPDISLEFGLDLFLNWALRRYDGTILDS
jgi:UDP-glucuronate decarboxylase